MSATAPVKTKAKITPAQADVAPKTRRKWTAQDRTDCLTRFAESSLKATDFCRKFGVNEATFSMWRQRAATSPRRAAVTLTSKGRRSLVAPKRLEA